MQSMRRVANLIMILALLVVGVSCSSRNGRDTLAGAVAMVIEYKTSQDYRGLWNASSVKFQRSNDGDPVEYEKYARSYGIHPNKIDVIKIDERTVEAGVIVRARYIESDGSLAAVTEEEWRFVKENGGWFIDGHRTISESEK